ncbi:32650_t:CDS:1, partial [Gigaspora margarita]
EIKEFNLTILINSKKLLVKIARMLRPIYYFYKIPKLWIEIKKDNKNDEQEVEENMKQKLLETLKDIKNYQKRNKSIAKKIVVPIIDQTKIKDTIAQLYKIFLFTKAPDFIFNIPLLPEAIWNIIFKKLTSC